MNRDVSPRGGHGPAAPAPRLSNPSPTRPPQTDADRALWAGWGLGAPASGYILVRATGKPVAAGGGR